MPPSYDGPEGRVRSRLAGCSICSLASGALAAGAAWPPVAANAAEDEQSVPSATAAASSVLVRFRLRFIVRVKPFIRWRRQWITQASANPYCALGESGSRAPKRRVAPPYRRYGLARP